MIGDLQHQFKQEDQEQKQPLQKKFDKEHQKQRLQVEDLQQQQQRKFKISGQQQSQQCPPNANGNLQQQFFQRVAQTNPSDHRRICEQSITFFSLQSLSNDYVFDNTISKFCFPNDEPKLSSVVERYDAKHRPFCFPLGICEVGEYNNMLKSILAANFKNAVIANAITMEVL